MSVGLDLAPGRHGGLHLRHPVTVAAGGAGFGTELLDAAGDGPPGAIVTRSVTRAADRGHPPPRLCQLDDGLLHSIGTPNPGLEAVVRRHGPRWATFDIPLVVSIRADNVEDISAMARTLDTHPEVSGMELDLAGPDRGRGGEPIGIDVEASELATVAARAATDLPLIVKLTAAAPDIREVAKAVAAAGADVISAIAPLPALALDEARRSALLGTAYGGLSGPALKPVGVRVVYEIAQVVRVPIIGVGGVHRLEDVLDYLAAGASAVGLATAALAEPALPGRLGAELGAWCERRGMTWPALIGQALPQRRDRGSLRAGRVRR
jgi:dihydroorotate dehydrogenase (NAD+) catalytic subunit